MDKGLGIEFEFTSPYSPQYNGHVEMKFATIYLSIRAMLTEAQLPNWLRHSLWTEAAAHATELQNILLSTNQTNPAAVALLKKEILGWRKLHPFREVAIVAYSPDTNKMQPKSKNRGRACLLLSRAPNQPADTLRFYNIETRKIIKSRDV